MVEFFKLEHYAAVIRREYVENYDSRTQSTVTQAQMKKAVAAHGVKLYVYYNVILTLLKKKKHICSYQCKLHYILHLLYDRYCIIFTCIFMQILIWMRTASELCGLNTAPMVGSTMINMWQH